MDDMWQKLDLKKVGIPQPKNEDTWKILVINRDRNVCSDMGAETTIEVKTLQWEEAWSLFLKIAGQHITSPVIKQHAETVLRKCNGLPLAIIILAKAMANRHMVEVWENAKRELKTSSASLQVSKPPVIVAALLGDLKNVCMLESGEKANTVKMHDVLHEMALRITSPELGHGPKFLVRASAELKEAPKATKWYDVERISLHFRKCTIKNDALIALDESQDLRDVSFNDCNGLTCVPTCISRGLHIVDCWDLERVLIGEETGENALQGLKFERICAGPPPSRGYLVNLKTIIIEVCPRLRVVFNKGMAQLFNSLEVLHCPLLNKVQISRCSVGDEPSCCQQCTWANPALLSSRPLSHVKTWERGGAGEIILPETDFLRSKDGARDDGHHIQTKQLMGKNSMEGTEREVMIGKIMDDLPSGVRNAMILWDLFTVRKDRRTSTRDCF
ncbi:hypothetical protein AMTR_s00032p00050560 [Amborella trichopoda]|uniref:NB-ARC domain-containing protein n=1 Tax=Amborella trichopoda TaxID=13333 RepID=U5D344_AMBTC|nr:hypothetical protein AMTR_s00032p00050560 [Amborella trichopoda]